MPGPDKDLSNILEKKEKELELVSLELKQAKETIVKLQMDGKFEDADLNILKLEQKLKLTDTELNLKEKLLIEAEEKCNFSENKLKKIEDFLESQKGTLVEMENKFEQSEKVSMVTFHNNLILFYCRKRKDSEAKFLSLKVMIQWRELLRSSSISTRRT